MLLTLLVHAHSKPSFIPHNSANNGEQNPSLIDLALITIPSNQTNCTLISSKVNGNIDIKFNNMTFWDSPGTRIISLTVPIVNSTLESFGFHESKRGLNTIVKYIASMALIREDSLITSILNTVHHNTK